MKRCPRCQQDKESAAFGMNRARRDGLQVHCRDCKRVVQQAWYAKHHDAHYANVKQRRQAVADQVVTRLIAYFQTHPCVDCGESDPVVLDFDHVRGAKRYEISSRIGAGYSWEGLLREIEKCEVRCANCHRRKTARQMGHRRALLMGLCGGKEAE
jgi:hypothetical protein